MHPQLPYAENAARLRLLYCLPLPRTAKDVQVVGAPEVTSALLPSWPGAKPQASLPLAADAPSAWDAIALAGVDLDAMDPAHRHEYLCRAYAQLRCSGWIVGHVRHASTLRGLIRGQGWKAAFLARRYFGRPLGCLAALRAAGFASPAVWYVHPDIEAPKGLISANSIAGRAEFLRSAHAGRGRHTAVGHLVRLTLARLDLGGLQQGQLFFWAQKAC